MTASSTPSSVPSDAVATEYDGAYQGAPGAYSEEAALLALGRRGVVEPRLLPCTAFPDVFEAVSAGRAAVGVIPVENTLAGAVQASYDLLLEHALTIIDEVVLRVSHTLIAPRGQALDGVRRVLSHPVALAQCRRFFVEHPGVTAVETYDTAGAVAQVVATGPTGDAAIASARAAAMYGGTVLGTQLEDDAGNFTRFVLVAPMAAYEDHHRDLVGTGAKTSLIITLAHRPGALVAALRQFADRGIDLSMIESRPRRGRPFEYAFYVDVAGIANESPLDEAIAQLAADSQSVVVLGSYPRDTSREDAPQGAP